MVVVFTSYESYRIRIVDVYLHSSESRGKKYKQELFMRYLATLLNEMAPKVNVKERVTDSEIDLSMSDLDDVPVKEIVRDVQHRADIFI